MTDVRSAGGGEGCGSGIERQKIISRVVAYSGGRGRTHHFLV